MFKSLRTKPLSVKIRDGCFLAITIFGPLTGLIHSWYIFWIILSLALCALWATVRAKEHEPPLLPWPRWWYIVSVWFIVVYTLAWVIAFAASMTGSDKAMYMLPVLCTVGVAFLIVMKVATDRLNRQPGKPLTQ